MAGRGLTLGLTLLATLLLAGSGYSQTPGATERADLPAEQIQSGYHFLTPSTRALQDDAFGNPGLLWVDRGAEAFNKGPNSCASCHDAQGPRSLVGVAARYPAYDPALGRPLNLEGRINQCRLSHQQRPVLAYESDPLLALTAYVAAQAKGTPQTVDITGPAAAYFQQGRDYFFQRKGQFNLACHQCHDNHWGKQLRGDIISQGHSNGFPVYRLEWQSLGSLHRRLQDCDRGIRASPKALGAEVYLGVELYLAWRARGLPMESPGVRR